MRFWARLLQTKKFGSKLQKIRKVILIKKIGKKDYYHRSLQKINHQEFQLKSWTKAVCMERGRYANLSTFATNEKVRVETAKDKKSNCKEDWKERLLSQKFTKINHQEFQLKSCTKAVCMKEAAMRIWARLLQTKKFGSKLQKIRKVILPKKIGKKE